MPAPHGFNMLGDSIFVATMLTSPATLIVKSGSNAPVRVEVGAGIVTSTAPMGLGGQVFEVVRDGKTVLSGRGGLDVKDRTKFYNFNVFVGGV